MSENAHKSVFEIRPLSHITASLRTVLVLHSHLRRYFLQLHLHAAAKLVCRIYVVRWHKTRRYWWEECCFIRCEPYLTCRCFKYCKNRILLARSSHFTLQYSEPAAQCFRAKNADGWALLQNPALNGKPNSCIDTGRWDIVPFQHLIHFLGSAFCSRSMCQTLVENSFNHTLWTQLV